jgi:hypothetical protein
MGATPLCRPHRLLLVRVEFGVGGVNIGLAVHPLVQP